MNKAYAKPYTIEVYNLTGNLLKSVKTSKPEALVNMEELRTGVYIIRVFDAYQKLLVTEKIIRL
jgi:hypothetical protein